MHGPQAGLGLHIPPIDLAIIVVYLVGITTAGLWSVRKVKMTGSAYFLAGRSLRWPVVGAALFAANISSIHLVGLAASGYKEGFVWGNFEWMAVFTLILLSLVFAPFYFRTRIATLPEYLERRYNAAARTILAVMAILAALLIHIGMSMYAGAMVFKEFFGLDVTTSIVIIALITSVYTVLGGLRAVMITETIQSVLLIGSAVTVTTFAILALPGAGIHSLTEFKAALKPDQLSMLLPAGRGDGLGWLPFVLGFPVLGIWYWCTDQTIVQRVLGAGSENDAQKGALFAGLLKVLPVFILVFPGVCGYVLFKDKIGADANQTLPVLINTLVPTGIKGLIAAGLLASLMSAIAAASNSCATLVAVDIVRWVKPATSDHAQVVIGRISAVAVMLLAMAWSTQGGRYSSIFEAINAIAAFIAPPITTCFLWGVFWKRGTTPAAIATLVAGALMGIAGFLVDFPVVGKVKLLTTACGIPMLMQAWWGFVICSTIYFVTSCCTAAPPPEKIQGLTWNSPLEVIFHGKLRGWSDPRVLGGLLLAWMVVLYAVFR
jgi:SSS family solute:Na+ symporter